MEAARAHLHPVPKYDPETGEVSCPHCLGLQDQLDGAHKEIKAWRARYANLVRDRQADAEAHALWPQAVRLFAVWKNLTGRKRSDFKADRFEQCLPFLKAHGQDMAVRAIVGIAFDHFSDHRKNGSRRKFDSWELLFRNMDRTEECANRAPKDWKLRASEAGWVFADD